MALLPFFKLSGFVAFRFKHANAFGVDDLRGHLQVTATVPVALTALRLMGLTWPKSIADAVAEHV